VAARALAHLGVESDRVRAQVLQIIGRGDRAVTGEIGLTPRAKKVIERAVEEAPRLGHNCIGTEHLLLGLLAQHESGAIRLLEELGARPEQVRAALGARMQGGPGSG
jgi:ATP-dependent Clp protease ATP-binding subunit ClpC